MIYVYQEHATLKSFHRLLHRTVMVHVGNQTKICLQGHFLSFGTEFILSCKKKITIISYHLFKKITKYSINMLKWEKVSSCKSFQVSYTPMASLKNILKTTVTPTHFQLVEVKNANFEIRKTWDLIPDLPLVSHANLFVPLSLSFLTNKTGIIPTLLRFCGD